MRAVKRTKTSLKALSQELKGNGRPSILSFLSSLPISESRVLRTETNKCYDRNHPLHDAALLTICYTRHALGPFIDTETYHKGISNLLTYIVPLRIDPSFHLDLLISKLLNRQLSIINITSPYKTQCLTPKKLVSDLNIHANTPQ